MNNMKVYGKLAQARVKLQQSNLKKTGKGHGFVYFELGDFLPRINEIFNELKLSSFTSITSETAKMTIADAEDGSTMTFEVPFANFKGDDKRKLQEVQELGGSITYLTRYLWVLALNIIEPDTVDRDKQATSNTTQTQQVKQEPVQQETQQVQEDKPAFEKVYWDGHSPLKQFDHFMSEDGLEYKTMKNKEGKLFGLCTDPNIQDSRKYYKLV
jgi:hypothetical protein